MTHPTEETLNDYIERELSPAEQVRVATHLDTCADCALVVAEFQQVVREASALGPMDAAGACVDAAAVEVDELESPQSKSRQSRAHSPSSRAHGPHYALGPGDGGARRHGVFHGRFVASARAADRVATADGRDRRTRERRRHGGARARAADCRRRPSRALADGARRARARGNARRAGYFCRAATRGRPCRV